MKGSTIPALLGAALLATLAACGGAEDTAADKAAGDSTAAAEPPAAPDTMAATPAAPADGGALVDPEQATREQLLAVPGMNEQLADAVVAGRPYANMLAVDSVLAAGGLAEAQREEVYRRLWKPLDLNSATGEEILLIPNLGEKMKHEFEEYRPYRNIEQFRREMGKYVEDEEVARLERYVTIRS